MLANDRLPCCKSNFVELLLRLLAMDQFRCSCWSAHVWLTWPVNTMRLKCRGYHLNPCTLCLALYLVCRLQCVVSLQ